MRRNNSQLLFSFPRRFQKQMDSKPFKCFFFLNFPHSFINAFTKATIIFVAHQYDQKCNFSHVRNTLLRWASTIGVRLRWPPMWTVLITPMVARSIELQSSIGELIVSIEIVLECTSIATENLIRCRLYGEDFPQFPFALGGGDGAIISRCKLRIGNKKKKIK